MIVASIDIGTNTVLLLVARVAGSGAIETLVYEQQAPRLGRDVDARGNIHPDAADRVIAVLLEYRRIIERHRPDAVAVCGTSAVRDARNRGEFLAQVYAATGFAVEVLTGEEEALWSYRGALSGLPGIGEATVVDIGGGSTEIARGSGRTLRTSLSLDIGSVRLTERYFAHDPPADAEVRTAAEVVRAALAAVPDRALRGSALVGVAGTAAALAILDQGLREFDIHALIDYSVRLDRVRELFDTLRAKPAAEIRRLSAVMEGRADVITAGTMILREIMEAFGFPTMTVSERGVRYGLVLREWERRAGREGE